MSSSPNTRNRWMLPAPKAPTTIALDFLKRTDVWVRVGLCFITAAILFVVCFGWEPPFSYRVREAPLRDLHARASFQYFDSDATEVERTRARQSIFCLYENDPGPLVKLRKALIDDLFELKQNTFAEVSGTIWPKFSPAAEPPQPTTPLVEGEDAEGQDGKDVFEALQQALILDERLETISNVVDKAFLNIDKNGVLDDLTHQLYQGSMQEIEVFPKGNLADRRRIVVSEILVAFVSETLRQNLIEELTKEAAIIPDGKIVAEHLHNWLVPQLPITLTWDEAASRTAAKLAADAIDEQYKQYKPGDPLEKQNNRGSENTFISAGVPLDLLDIDLLKAEHDSFVADLGLGPKLLRSVLFFGLFAAIFSLICAYLYSRDRLLLTDTRRFATLLTLFLFTMITAWWLSLITEWRSEVIPVVLFAMTIAIAYNIELSIILSGLVALAFAVAHNFGLSEFVILSSASSTAALLCRTIRSRTKLVYIGMIAATVVFPTVIGVEYLLGQPLGSAMMLDALWFAGSAGLAGLFMTALLPFLERWFDIQTDISLLELSDANHPLLRELVQRAPGTYNHSINVASISEAAAEAIGANGLLCRVGAYFHDVGKLRKPEYFIENQGGGANKHDDLVPTMSTLVIIAHVKDGAEIGRTHRLPKRIIDLIEQHHGTTLVEYFFNRATKQNEELEEAAQIDEADFRYPGPRPQTPEAAVMMLADAVESASRALREPTPARIENLVREMAKKRLDDGQFDQCSITIKQLNTIQESLIKSLNAMYHARVKYPDQQSA